MEHTSDSELKLAAAAVTAFELPVRAGALGEPPAFSRPGDDSAATLWFALRTKPRHERVVHRNLSGKGYECFSPCCRKTSPFQRRRAEWDPALFPGYLFCRFDPVRRLPVLTTPGVWGIVSVGRQPLPVDETEIDSLRLALRAGASARPVPFPQSGQPVRITDGPLAGVEGIVVNSRNPMRVMVSIALLQRSVLLEIDGERLREERPFAPAWPEVKFRPGVE